MKFIDITGQRFGRLVVQAFSHHDKKCNSYWDCICDCGVNKKIRGSHLKDGGTLSCGCFQRENIGKQAYRHGGWRTRIYRIWKGMQRRCYCLKEPGYLRYGGRGITVCSEWLDFKSFRGWALANGYQDHLSIDRIDNNKGYSPENCRWATTEVQGNNRSNNTHVIYEGEIYTNSLLARKLGVGKSTIGRWVKSGKLERVFNVKTDCVRDRRLQVEASLEKDSFYRS